MKKRGWNPGRRKIETRSETLAIIDQVFDLSLEHVPVREIAERFGLTLTTTYRYITYARKRFHRKTYKKAEAQRSASLAELQHLKKLAYAEWHRSKLNAESEVEEIGEVDGKPTYRIRKEKKGRVGDRNFLAEVRECIKEEIKLFGLPIPPITDAQLEEMIEGEPSFVEVKSREEYLQFEELKNASRSP